LDSGHFPIRGRKKRSAVKREHLQCQLLFWAGTNSRFDEPFFEIGADNIRMILQESPSCKNPRAGQFD
jgi:hypothetical protein